jgi:hypothetical protein
MRYGPAPGERVADEARVVPLERRRHELLGRAVALAHAGSAQPYRATAALVALNLVLIAGFAALGQLVFADPAELFRELMPGTWLSVAQLAAVALVAWAIHATEAPGARLRLDNLWGISVVVFCVFAFDEATQLTIFLADGLAALGALAPAGFKDLDAFLVVVLLVAGGAALLRYGFVFLRYPGGLALLAVGVALGAGSQTLDSVLASTSSEFVAEETLKLLAEPFLIGAYLVALGRVLAKPSG